MNSQNSFIPKQLPSKSQDFYTLREEGIKLLEQLTGLVWTDFNSHDPGITILEALCYALTELSLKANMNIEDLITRVTGNLDEDLFPLQEALPGAPRTFEDYRKYLIDHPLVKNAWIGVASIPEQAVYLDPASGDLTFDELTEIAFQGLYNLYLELEEEEPFGNLNTPSLTRTIQVGTDDLDIHFSFPGLLDTGTLTDQESYWEHADIYPDWFLNLSITAAVVETAIAPLAATEVEDYFIRIEVAYTRPDMTPASVILGIDVTLPIPLPENLLLANILNAIESELTATGDNSLNDNTFWKTFNRKIIRVHTIIAELRQYFLLQRNLAEDLVNIQTIRFQDIAVNGLFILNPNEDVAELLASIFLNIERFIAPEVIPKSLDDLLEQKRALEQIYEGPPLDGYFLDDEAIKSNFRNDIIYTSDLLQIILGRKSLSLSERAGDRLGDQKVIAVQNLTISNFINNQLVTGDIRNCLELFDANLYKPRFRIERSQIVVKKSNLTVEWDVGAVMSRMSTLRTEQNTRGITSPQHLSGIKGVNLLFQEYHSIQRDFPIAYGIGEGALLPSASPLRIAQARQLKGYLIILEQLLADGAIQLEAVKDFFSFTSRMDESFFSQPLNDVPDLNDLVASDYITSSELENLRDLKKIDRLSQLQDHLSGRLSEDLRPIGRWMLENQRTTEWLEDQQLFLGRQPEISRNRGLGFDPAMTFQLSGYEQRVSTLLGLKYFEKRRIINALSSFVTISGAGPSTFTVNDFNNTLLYTSPAYPDALTAEQRASEFVMQGQIKANYIIDDTNPLNVILRSELPSEIHLIGSFPSREQAENELNDLVSFLQTAYGLEGFHVVEHLLLRPRDSVSISTLLNILRDDNGDLIPGEENPYSARASILIPQPDEYPDFQFRFLDTNFQQLLIDTIRLEAPAHIKLDIYFLEETRMEAFEDAYFDWLTEFSNNDFESLAYRNDLIALVTELNDIRLNIASV